MKETLSVILIAHNEERAIGPMLEGLLATYGPEILEVIVVDDASTDQTGRVVSDLARENPKIRSIQRTPPRGVGRALRAGFGNISPKAEYVLTMDSDFVENIPQVRALLDAIEKENCDGVIGSRFVHGGRIVRYPFMKRLMNRLFHITLKILFGVKHHDLTNNFKLYKVHVLRSQPWRSNGFAMNAETGLLPILAGYNVIEVPVIWVGRDHSLGKSKFHLLKHGGGYLQVIRHALHLKRSHRSKS
jgi:dolichol-phosphate mannosyltransferase